MFADPDARPELYVICLEGAHGCGKSAVLEELGRRGHRTMDEGFLDQAHLGGLHPQTLVMESLWVARWVERLLVTQSGLERDGGRTAPTVIFADRSPYSAVCYAQARGDLLEPLIGQQIEDLCGQANVHVYTVYLHLPLDTLWSRVQSRLLIQPERKAYREHVREWMDAVFTFYADRDEAGACTWDYTVDRTHLDVPATTEAVLSILDGIIRGSAAEETSRGTTTCCQGKH